MAMAFETATITKSDHHQSSSKEIYNKLMEHSDVSNVASTMTVPVEFETSCLQVQHNVKKPSTTSTLKSNIVKATGSKRRRMLPPVKNRQRVDECSIPFFEKQNLIKVEICCGGVYRYAPFGDTFVIDTDEYKPCPKHQKRSNCSSNTEIIDLNKISTDDDN